MLIIAGTITMDPAHVDEAMAAATEMMKATHQEAGCIEYVFSIDPLTPGLVRIFEMWETEEALAGHFTAPHMAEFGAKIANLTITGRDIKKYTVGEATDL